MANAIRGEVAVESRGQMYTLVMDTNAMVELEDFLSTPDKPVVFQEALQGVLKNNVRYIRAFVWAALRRHHANMSIKDAGLFIDGAGGLAGFAEQLAKIAAATRPDKEDTATAGATADDGRPIEAPADRKRGPGARSIDSRAKSA